MTSRRRRVQPRRTRPPRAPRRPRAWRFERRVGRPWPGWRAAQRRGPPVPRPPRPAARPPPGEEPGRARQQRQRGERGVRCQPPVSEPWGNRTLSQPLSRQSPSHVTSRLLLLAASAVRSGRRGAPRIRLAARPRSAVRRAREARQPARWLRACASPDRLLDEARHPPPCEPPDAPHRRPLAGAHPRDRCPSVRPHRPFQALYWACRPSQAQQASRAGSRGATAPTR